jgi:chemotaxis protein CheC
MLTPENLETLQELVNVGAGKAAGLLHELVNLPIELTIPEVSIVTRTQVSTLGRLEGSDHLDSVGVAFTGEFNGQAVLVFPSASARALVGLVSGDSTEDDMDSLRSETLTEVGNILMNGVMGSISNMLSTTLDYLVPEYRAEKTDELLDRVLTSDRLLLLIRTCFFVEKQRIEGDVFFVLDMDSFERLALALNRLQNEVAS